MVHDLGAGLNSLNTKVELTRWNHVPFTECPCHSSVIERRSDFMSYRKWRTIRFHVLTNACTVHIGEPRVIAMADPGNAAGNMPVPWTEHPAFDDIYVYEMGGEYSVRVSSFRKIKRMWTFWLNFANSVSRPSTQVAPYKGLGLFGSTVWPQTPQENGWDHVLIARFFPWLRDNGVATKDMVETSKLWMNHHLKAEAAAYGFGRSVYSCGTIAVVSLVRDRFFLSHETSPSR
jgi:hypothetical protein